MISGKLTLSDLSPVPWNFHVYSWEILLLLDISFTGGAVITERTRPTIQLHSCHEHDPSPAQVGRQDWQLTYSIPTNHQTQAKCLEATPNRWCKNKKNNTRIKYSIIINILWIVCYYIVTFQGDSSISSLISAVRDQVTSSKSHGHPYYYELEQFKPTEQQLELREPQVTLVGSFHFMMNVLNIFFLLISPPD